MTAGLYVYGIVRTGALAEAPRATAVEPTCPPRLLTVGELTAVVSEVDVGEFEGATLEHNVARPEWLEQKVRAHECVLDEVVATATVVPMRFGSIFSAEEGLRSMLAANAEAFEAALGDVEGRTEWGVKVHCDARALSEQLAAAEVAAPVSGRGYLLQKKARLDAEAKAGEAAVAVAEAVHEQLARCADDAAVSPRRGVVLNAAYLVRDDARDEFMGRVEELRREHGDAFFFDVTGPWPAYHFVAADVGGPR